jgi:polyisoprenoid-binding protein YceI
MQPVLRLGLAAIGLALLLSACGGQEPGLPVPSATPEPPAQEGEEARPTAQAVSPTSPAEQPAAGSVTFEIVSGESRASYAVDETFLNQNNRLNTAVGISTEVSGTVTVDTANPAASTLGIISVDISQLQSDDARRDDRIRQSWLESARYPIASFEVTAIEGLPAAYADGQEVSFQLIGNLTVREVAVPTTWEVTAAIQGETLTGTATTTILMTDFGFDPPSIGGILTVENEVIVTIELVAKAQ